MKKRKTADELKIVNLDDNETKTEFPLIEKERGSITYEHCLVEKLFGEIYVGTAERNYYIDKYHELCLCVSYNRRIPGKYKFDNRYHFFVTKKRMCLNIYWNLGNISDPSMILEYYDSIEEAKKSTYYEDYIELMNMIDEWIDYKKRNKGDSFFHGVCSFSSYKDKSGDEYYIYEIPIEEKNEVTQFYYNTRTKEWEKMSITLEPILDIMRFFKDFDDLDYNELHLRKFYSIDNQIFSIEPLYYEALKIAKEDLQERLNYTGIYS